MNITLPDDLALRVKSISKDLRLDPERMVLDNIRVSVRDYEHQRLHPMPQRVSPLVVGASQHGRKVLAVRGS